MKPESFGFLLVAAGGLGLAYYLFRSGGPLGAGAPDPGGGAPASSALSAILNQLDIGKSSLSFSDATQSLMSNPIADIESILGIEPGSSDTSDSTDTNGGF